MHAFVKKKKCTRKIRTLKPNAISFGSSVDVRHAIYLQHNSHAWWIASGGNEMKAMSIAQAIDSGQECLFVLLMFGLVSCKRE